jgi:hypothetical protein
VIEELRGHSTAFDAEDALRVARTRIAREGVRKVFYELKKAQGGST